MALIVYKYFTSAVDEISKGIIDIGDRDTIAEIYSDVARHVGIGKNLLFRTNKKIVSPRPGIHEHIIKIWFTLIDDVNPYQFDDKDSLIPEKYKEHQIDIFSKSHLEEYQIDIYVPSELLDDVLGDGDG